MNITTSCNIALAAVALLGVAACSGEAPMDEASADAMIEEEAAQSEEIATVKQALTSLPKRGGSGGTQWAISAPQNYFAFKAYTGSWVDSLNFKYHYPPYGDFETGRYGGAGGVDQGWKQCNGSDLAIGYRVRVNSYGYVQAFGLTCRSSLGYNYTLSIVGGTGGTEYYDSCPTNQRLKGMYIWFGTYVDAIQGLCG